MATAAVGLAIAGPAAVPVSTLHALAAAVNSLRMHVGMTPQLRRLCDDTQRDLRATQHDASLRVVCPLLVPEVRLMLKNEYAGTFGLLDSTAHGDFYGITVNNGGDDPRGFSSLHWIVGKGPWAAIRTKILSDKENVVKGKPTFLGIRTLLGHRARVYRFPPHPAGGAFGSHTIAFVQAGRTVAFASVHGDHLDASVAMAVAYALQLGG